MLEIGVSKKDITAFKKGVLMQGYGVAWNTAEEIETPLYARSFVFKEKETNIKIALVVCELGFITHSLKRGVLKKLSRDYPHLEFRDEHIVLMAQHTHAAPGGFYGGLYSMGIPGFIFELYQKIVAQIVQAIVEAYNNMQNARVQMGKGVFAPEIPVAFNRTIHSYNQNTDVPKYTEKERHLAVDREMTFLKCVNIRGESIASINWFAVHPSNLSNMNHKVCSDNKGYAATYLEETLSSETHKHIAAFAQGACGDVSARWKYNASLPAKRGKYEGMYPDEVKSAQYNGRLQYEKALEIHQNIDKESSDIGHQLDIGMMYVNWGEVKVNPHFANGATDAFTSPSILGVSFIGGSKWDGPGTPPWLTSLIKKVCYTREKVFPITLNQEEKNTYRHIKQAQGNKELFIESGDKKILGVRNLEKLPIPSWIDETVRNLKYYAKRGGLHNKKPWTPQIMPIQIIKIGDVAIATFPFEITTVASWRLKASIENILLGNGYKHVILCPYANDYSGYITTFEEYQMQDYEGGHCVFGQWALGALQTKFEELCKEMIKPKKDRNLHSAEIPPDFTLEEMRKFKYHDSLYFIRQERKRARQARRKSRREGKTNHLNL